MSNSTEWWANFEANHIRPQDPPASPPEPPKKDSFIRSIFWPAAVVLGVVLGVIAFNVFAPGEDPPPENTANTTPVTVSTTATRAPNPETGDYRYSSSTTSYSTPKMPRNTTRRRTTTCVTNILGKCRPPDSYYDCIDRNSDKALRMAMARKPFASDIELLGETARIMDFELCGHHLP